MSFERRVVLLALLSTLPATIVAMVLLWRGDYSTKLQWTITILVAILWGGFMYALIERVTRPLQTLSNMLGALREGDYSMRARGAWSEDTLGLALLEANALGDLLREQRLGALEATALLRRVMEEIDVAIFAFDDARRLRLANRGAERLTGQPAEQMLGKTSAALGLAECLRGEAVRTFSGSFPGGAGKWEMRRSSFRQGGKPHHLVVLTDLSRALREEERLAWQRLVRVLGHEINNSLAPIKSIAGSLQQLLRRATQGDDWREDFQGGLAVIAGRAESLSRFMTSYALLARLPRPEPGEVDVAEWVRRVARLETRLKVDVKAGPPVTIQADGDQLDQLLINLVRNAADASLETGGGVAVSWSRNGAYVEVRVDDEGMGLSDTANLFVPFFTTKPEGSGIGLVLSRQIAEAHGGTLTLENRDDHRGCEATLRLPLSATRHR
jgi:PAS domain S-box-containing protein